MPSADPRDLLVPNNGVLLPQGARDAIKRYYPPQFLDGTAFPTVNLATKAQVLANAAGNQLYCPLMAGSNRIVPPIWMPGNGPANMHTPDVGSPISWYIGRLFSALYIVVTWTVEASYSSPPDAGWIMFRGIFYASSITPNPGDPPITIPAPALPSFNNPLYLPTPTFGIGPVVRFGSMSLQLDNVIMTNDGSTINVNFGNLDVTYEPADNDPYDPGHTNILDNSGPKPLSSTPSWHFFTNLSEDWDAMFAPSVIEPYTYGFNISVTAFSQIALFSIDPNAIDGFVGRFYLDPGPPHYPQIIP